MGALKPWHIIVLVVVLLLLLGSKKLPQMARGLGQSMRILKSETEEMKKKADKPEEKGDDRAEPKHSREPIEGTIEGESVADEVQDRKKTS
ncbi:Sec-independent protein translocase subunit TatA [Salininema proteolyticum]|uniref:Sec-independent protein translocase protein TatA n=1 Tax=Salininema proteolyticum TaxID=1607685 RepID=A0ABV8U3F7_9ACTN